MRDAPGQRREWVRHISLEPARRAFDGNHTGGERIVGDTRFVDSSFGDRASYDDYYFVRVSCSAGRWGCFNRGISSRDDTISPKT